MKTTIYVETENVQIVRDLLEPYGNMIISKDFDNPMLPTTLTIQFEKITNLQRIQKVAKKYAPKENFKKTDLIK